MESATDPDADFATEVAALRDQANQVFGNKENVEQWLNAPALALGQRRPVDLLTTTEGRETLRTLLTQLEYGVYM